MIYNFARIVLHIFVYCFILIPLYSLIPLRIVLFRPGGLYGRRIPGAFWDAGDPEDEKMKGVRRTNYELKDTVLHP